MNNYNMSLGVLQPLGTYVIMECVEGRHRSPYDPLRHMNNYNMSLGVLGPLGTYVVMESVKGDHKSSYDPV